MKFSTLFKKILSAIFPPTCFWCWIEWSYLCKSCHSTIHPHPELCPVCHRFSQYWKTCLNCFKVTSLDWVLIGFSYQWAIKKAKNHSFCCVHHYVLVVQQKKLITIKIVFVSKIARKCQARLCYQTRYPKQTLRQFVAAEEPSTI